MIEVIKENIQKHYVSSFNELGIDYYVNRVDDAQLPYIKLWELNSWCEEYKTHNEMFVRFTFWVWDDAYKTKNTFDLLKTINDVSNKVVEVIPEILTVEKEKEAIRDAQKPDSKCSVVVYKYKIIGGKL